MDGKISAMSLVVSNKVNSLAFFTEKVGFDKKTDVTGPNGYRYVTVGPKGGELELALWEVGSASDPAQADFAKHWAPGRVPPVVITVADCKKSYELLSSKGVEFLRPPLEQPWGVVATFKDPDGNLFSISQFAQWSKK